MVIYSNKNISIYIYKTCIKNAIKALKSVSQLVKYTGSPQNCVDNHSAIMLTYKAMLSKFFQFTKLNMQKLYVPILKHHRVHHNISYVRTYVFQWSFYATLCKWNYTISSIHVCPCYKFPITMYVDMTTHTMVGKVRNSLFEKMFDQSFKWWFWMVSSKPLNCDIDFLSFMPRNTLQIDWYTSWKKLQTYLTGHYEFISHE